MTNGHYWSSSPDTDESDSAWEFNIYGNSIDPVGSYVASRNQYGSVRCLKDSTSESSALKYRWQTDSTCSTDESDYISTSRESYDETNTTATATVTTDELGDGSYYLCVLE